jgi:Porin subfamily
MKMVKSLLLGSAAGLVAASAGQAADLPVKAKPVEYVKVCSLYGAGFYYIPGTDTCIKLGGFLRTEWNIHAAGSFATFTGGGNAFQTRSEDNYITRARGYLTTDVREQTSYGTLRAYLAAGWQYTTDDAPTISLPGIQATGTSTHAGTGLTTTFTGNNANNSNISLLRAFIQWGGFTFGKTASFYDFFNTSKYSLQTNFIYQDFAGVGIFTYGYTQQLGNGIAATIAVQDPSPFENQIVDVHPAPATGPFASSTSGGPTTVNLGTTSNVFLPGANNNINTAGTLVPDFVGSIRVDQAWGGAQIAAIAHDNRALYYNNPTSSGGVSSGPGFGTIKGSDHPSDKWGFAVQGGIELNLPWAKGDSFAIQSAYCDGASYACYNRSGTRFSDSAWNLINVNKIGLGWVDDAYYASPGTGVGPAIGLELTRSWNVWAAIQHYWVPELRTSLYGGYFNYKADSSAVDNVVCAPLNQGRTITGASSIGIPTQTAGLVAASGCADWAAWAIGSRTLWNPTKNLDIGVDVLYTSMAKSAFSGAQFNLSPAVAGTPGGSGSPGNVNQLTSADTHIWAGILRIQYNFYP